MTWKELAAHRKRQKAKGVICSNGMKFNSTCDAVAWLRSTGWIKASQGGVTACLTGKYRSAYGYKWEYEKEDNSKEVQRNG